MSGAEIIGGSLGGEEVQLASPLAAPVAAPQAAQLAAQLAAKLAVTPGAIVSTRFFSDRSFEILQ